MLELPLQPIPAQTVKSVLDGQNFQVYLYQKSQGLFVDIAVNGVDVMSGVIARDSVPLISRDYAGLVGNILLTDTQGASDPDYTGLGSRFSLIYLTAAEYALI